MPTYDDVIAIITALKNQHQEAIQLSQQHAAAHGAPAGGAAAAAAAAAAAGAAAHAGVMTQKASVDVLLKAHQRWINSLFGVAGGYEREAQGALKDTRKGRLVTMSQTADVSTTNAGAGTKAVQYKFTGAGDTSAVNTKIKEAVNQLTGERGETPTATQRRIADITINNPNSTWPFEPGSELGILASQGPDLSQYGLLLSDFAMQAEYAILNCILEHEHGKVGMGAGTLSSLHDFGRAPGPGGLEQPLPPGAVGAAPGAVPGAPPAAGGAAAAAAAAGGTPVTEAPHLQRPAGTGGKSTALEPAGIGGTASILTVKINFIPPRQFADRPAPVSRMHFSGYRNGMNFQVRYLENPLG